MEPAVSSEMWDMAVVAMVFGPLTLFVVCWAVGWLAGWAAGRLVGRRRGRYQPTRPDSRDTMGYFYRANGGHKSGSFRS